LLHAGRRHRGATPFAEDLSFYWIHFVIDASAARGAQLELQKFTLVQRPDCVAELFHRYLDDQEAGRLDPLYAGLLLLQILCEVSRKEATAQPARGASITGRAEAYVTRHLTEQLSTARIARALRVNPDYLNRAFRKLHQLTITEYIHRRRLADAATLLRDTTQSVEEIASACGYRSVAHFRRVFQRVRGVSPLAYRGLMARAYVNTR
jgi:AraC-like DNA-binding protein